MHADSYFAIGKTHHICEDYAWAGIIPWNAMTDEGLKDKRFAAAIVSDGCSSSPDTDFGSRLLVRSAINRMMIWADHFNPLWVISDSSHMARSILLSQRSLDATLLTAFQTEYAVTVSICGDGVIMGRKRNGDIDYITVEFSNNAPGYLSYTLSPERLESYLSEDNSQCFNPVFKKNGRTGVRSIKFFQDMEESSEEVSCLLKEEFKRFEARHVFCQDEYDLVFVFTDGVQSFQRKTETGMLEDVPLADVLEQLINIKVTTGRFLARRCQKFLKSFCQKYGWFHNDDFGAAAIYMGDE